MELTVNGKHVHASTGGKEFDSSLPVVIFVHGAGQDRTAWALQTRYFAYHGYGVLAVDLPGHGKSEGPILESLPEMGDWLADLIAASGAGKASLVGHSMGSFVALECAARHPDAVRSLTLIGTAAQMPVHPDLLAAAKANDRSAYEAITYWGFSPGAQIGRDQSPGMWMVGSGMQLMASEPDGALHTGLKACADYDGAAAAAAKVTCPVRLILADQDSMTPLKRGKALADAFHEAETIIIPQCGHMLMAEQPDAVLDALIGFV
ncbi:MAG: alpha/beta hydrolase [Alphaproteobacteria bacterium]|nr:alpha/beta hydrolase [Alphaproteobacteria bacterium]